MDKALNRYIDHTLLRADATEHDIRRLVEEAVEYDFAAVCVNGCYVKTAARFLRESRISDPDIGSVYPEADGSHLPAVAAVVGFPLGAASTDSKIEEARIAIDDGASEIDMVINIGAVKDGRWDYVRNEIYNLAQICHRSAEVPALLKVILETCLLSDEEIIRACHICHLAGADYVKTSTGFSDGGASVHHVRLMKEASGDLMKETSGGAMKVKASGGIRTLSDALSMIDAGADRLGCSASVAIMEELAGQRD